MKISFVSQLVEKIKSCNCFKDFCFLCSDVSNTEAVKMPFFQLGFTPFGLFTNNIRKFFIIAMPYALVMSIISTVFGFAYLCSYSNLYEVKIFCSKSILGYAFYNVIKITVLAMFLVNWYSSITKNETFKLKDLYVINKPMIKMIGALLIFLIVSLIPLLSFYMLYIRIPNPDWRIEITYFAVVSIGFFAPFVAMKFYSIFAFVASGEDIPPLKLIWAKNSGNMLKMIMAIFMIFIMVVFVVLGFFNNFKDISGYNQHYLGFVAEFLHYIIFYIIASIMFNHCLVQKTILFKGPDNEQK